MLLSSVGGCNIVFVFVFPAAPLCGGSRPATAGRLGNSTEIPSAGTAFLLF